jgi:triple functional domain protein
MDVLQLLQERFVLLPGGRDKRGGPIICFPATPKRERAKPEDLKRILNYLMGVPKYVEKNH